MERKDLNFKLVYNPDWMHWVDSKDPYEPEVLEVMLRFVQPGDRVIDAGANLGLFSLCLSQMVGETGEVYAFEPDERHFAELVKNVELNGRKNICCLKQALWVQDAWGKFNSLPYGGYSSFIYYLREEVTQQVVYAQALDSLINTGYDFRLLKIDCEGSEEYILRGARGLLSHGVDAVIVEINFKLLAALESSFQNIRDFMHSLDYDLFLLHRNGARPLYIPRDSPIEIKNDIMLVNVLFSSKEKVATLWT